MQYANMMMNCTYLLTYIMEDEIRMRRYIKTLIYKPQEWVMGRQTPIQLWVLSWWKRLYADDINQTVMNHDRNITYDMILKRGYINHRNRTG